MDIPLTITQILGFCALITTFLQYPSHAAYLLRHKHDTSILQGVSATSILFITTHSLILGIYGVLYDAYFLTLSALSGTAIIIIINILIKANLWHTLPLLAYILFIITVFFTAIDTPQEHLKASAVLMAISMWIPAAFKALSLHHTPAALAYPPITSWLIILSNALTIIYGVLIDNIWLWIAAPFSIVCAMIMLSTYHSTKRYIAFTEAPTEVFKQC